MFKRYAKLYQRFRPRKSILTKKANEQAFFRNGEYGIWLFAGALACCVTLVSAVMILILVKGFAHFMPRALYAFEIRHGEETLALVGEIVSEETVPRAQLVGSGYKPQTDADFYERTLVKVGNREYGSDFVWVVREGILSQTRPKELMTIERREYGNFYGYPIAMTTGTEDATRYDLHSMQPAEWYRLLRTNTQRATRLVARAYGLEKGDLGKINYGIEKLRLRVRRLELQREASPQALAAIAQERNALQARYAVLAAELDSIHQQLARDTLIMQAADGTEVRIPFARIVRLYQPNRLNLFAKIRIYGVRLVEFITGDPRESNTEGGIFPAIFGTVMMVLLMTIFVLPLGVIAAIYLYLYAKQNRLTRMVRIAVNNLAGIPSIVYGMFGLGFFVYTIGGSIDRLFYPEALPSPTFGSGGILWASLTLALLTLPVVIVATEEGLVRIPRNLTEGSMALGATRLETLLKISLPVASPAIMTGMILAIARATGEVAPLMLVGAVKLAPSLPLDANFPFIHAERKFMHLGFHIYDIGFQSPNIEAARPLVYATAALLILIIIILNSTAVYLRNRLREKFRNLN